jgi:hypothetical protein
MNSSSPYWRNTFKQPRLAFFDGRLSYVLLAFLLHWSFTTLILLIFVGCFLYYIEKYKSIDLMGAIRATKVAIMGNHRPSKSYIQKQYMVDNRYIWNERF